MKKFLSFLNAQTLFIQFPIVLYFVFKIIESTEGYTNIGIYSSAIFFYVALLYSIFYFVLYQSEKIAEYLSSKIDIKILLFKIGWIVVYISLTFAAYYWCIYDYDKNSFKNVAEESKFLTFFDFIYYSFGIFLMNNISEVSANNFYSKLFSLTQILTSFSMLVLIFGNYSNFKKE